MPWRRTRPDVGISKPAIIRRVVVLPDPEGPSIEKNSPSRTSRSTWSTATSPTPATSLTPDRATRRPVSPPVEKTFVSPSSRIAGTASRWLAGAGDATGAAVDGGGAQRVLGLGAAAQGDGRRRSPRAERCRTLPVGSRARPNGGAGVAHDGPG